MKSKLFVMVLVVFSMLLVASCGVANEGTSADIPDKQSVTLSLALRDQVKITISGDSKSYYVGSEVWDVFNGGMYWVRCDGSQLSLQDAVRISDPTPLTGTWNINTAENGKTFLYVYADSCK